MMINFTVPEINMICIYHGRSKGETVANIIEGIVYMIDPDMVSLAEQTVDKLLKITESDFMERDFETEYAE